MQTMRFSRKGFKGVKDMNEQDYEKLNDFAASFEQFTGMIELAASMVEELACGNITDDEKKTMVHIDRMWALMDGLVQLAHLKDVELEELVHSVPIIKNTNEQSQKE